MRRRITSLVKILREGDKIAKKEALGELLERVKEGKSIISAESALYKVRSEGDRELKSLAELVLLYYRFGYVDFGSMLWFMETCVTSWDTKRKEKGEEILDYIISRYNVGLDDPNIRLFAGECLGAEDPKIRRSATSVIATFSRKRIDISPIINHISEALSRLDHDDACTIAHSLFYSAITENLDISSTISGLERLLSFEDPITRFRVAQALTWHFLRERNKDRISEICNHESYNVREGCVSALKIASEKGIDVGFVVDILSMRLSDSSGGVIFDTIKTLLNIVRTGVDISEAVPELHKRMKGISYEMKGWTFGFDLISASELVEESATYDIAMILTYHYLNCGDHKAIKALLQTDEIGIISGVYDALSDAPNTSPELLEEAKNIKEDWKPRLLRH